MLAGGAFRERERNPLSSPSLRGRCGGHRAEDVRDTTGVEVGLVDGGSHWAVSLGWQDTRANTIVNGGKKPKDRNNKEAE